ncbi:hypothetical protein [Xylophilus sp. GOD-11R]|uniref:hypothetical protein n=1 Tax=Xylophilus sp. GOD-11R TaxID=3089814 RepID=UPI00298D2471|nr:hypothetical protein [Xylophilus sp. GOD-11R]WPB58983.1 hypothetical protein R9X41_10235 [Xylophilus sp. GOD-11R]
MSSIGSVLSHTAEAAWNTVKQTVRSANEGDLGDMAKVAVGAAVLTGAMPASTGVAVLAGNAALGQLLDVFA